MSIPVVSDIIDAFKWIVDFFMNKAPKPLKFILFLVMLLFFASLIPYFLQLTGIHCNTDKQVMKIGVFSLVKNYDILNTKDEVFTGETLQFEDVHPRTDPNTCYFYMKEKEDLTYEECIVNQTNTTGCNYYYKDALNFNCAVEKACFKAFFFCTWYDVCKGDAIASEDGLSEWFVHHPEVPFEDELDLPSLECYIPRGYVWSYSLGYYSCYNDSICGNGTQAYSIIDEKLTQAGAEFYYQDGNENSYKNFIQFKCDSRLNPQLTIYGIPLFDYRVWLVGTLIFFMGYFLIVLKRNQG